MEIVHVDTLARASGTQIGRAHEVRLCLTDDHLELEVVGQRRAAVDLGDADFFDVFASPFFNSLPVVRDNLLDGGPPRDYVMRFIRVPDLTVVRSDQRYTPRGGGDASPVRCPANKSRRREKRRAESARNSAPACARVPLVPDVGASREYGSSV
jgi:hypothetical protein